MQYTNFDRKLLLILISILLALILVACGQPNISNMSIESNIPADSISKTSLNTTSSDPTAGTENRYTFYVLYKQDDQLSQDMKQVTSMAQTEISASADFVYLDTAEESTKILMKKYNISNAPIPITVVIAPDGAMISVFPEKVNLTQLNNSLTSAASSTTQSSTVITVNPSDDQIPLETASPIVNITPDSTVLSATSGKTPDRVDVVYFHQTQRCVKCLCFEERISHVIYTDYQNELDSGKLTYQIIDMGNKANKAIATQYKAIGSQMFVNSIINEADNIEDIMGIWSWNCTSDADGFDLKIKNIIESKLRGKS